MRKLLILIGCVASLASCNFKEYKPYDNAINALEAKESTEKLSTEISIRTKIKLDSLKNGYTKN